MTTKIVRKSVPAPAIPYTLTTLEYYAALTGDALRWTARHGWGAEGTMRIARFDCAVHVYDSILPPSFPFSFSCFRTAVDLACFALRPTITVRAA